MKDKLITSKQVMEKAKISRATLNNYIKYGILPKPFVRAPGQGIEGPTKIGYFPCWVIQKIRDVQAMKREGKAMDEIARILARNAEGRKPGTTELEDSRIEPSRQRDGIQIINDNQIQSYLPLCVLAVHFQDLSRIKIELPPLEYFELINRLWQNIVEISDYYQGVRGRYPGEGFLCYFLKKPGIDYIINALKCGFELIEKVKIISKEWQTRKGWFDEININTGLDAGIIFLGTIKRGHDSEFEGVGGAVTRAVQISQAVRCGAVLATKDLVSMLDDEERKSIVYGVRKKHPEKGWVFIVKSFSRLFDLLDSECENRDKFMDISSCAVTEIVSIAVEGSSCQVGEIEMGKSESAFRP